MCPTKRSASTSGPLRDLLRQVEVGKAQLPEFQRGWVWPYPNIAGLLASISLSYPVGTVMLLKAGGDVRFKYRPIEGATPAGEPVPDTLDENSDREEAIRFLPEAVQNWS